MARFCSLGLLLCVVTSSFVAVSCQSAYTNIGRVNLTLPGFTDVFQHEDETDPARKYSLLVATFLVVPFYRDSSYALLYPGEVLDDLGSLEPTLLFDNFTWPRELRQNPREVFGFDTLTQADGFITPGKNDGSLFIIDVRDFSNPLTYDIAKNESNPDRLAWFYHRVTWKDINLDGLLDALTCRARRFGDPSMDETQMLWFEHPQSAPLGGEPWTEHLINENICDTFQVDWTFDLPEEGPVYAFFTVGYFYEVLAVHWTTDPNGSWEDPALIQTRVIDTGHRFFDLKVADANNDGRMDLLVSLNAEFNGSIVAYEIPDDFRTGDYRVHLLADGFNATSGVPAGGTPGSLQAYYPTADESGKPWVLFSGDDSGAIYYLTPQTEEPGDWNYDLNVILDRGVNNIIGQPSVMDVDGDGSKEVFVPVYFENVVEVFRYDPSVDE